jgi:cob(I)alamin adenosyltransferase
MNTVERGLVTVLTGLGKGKTTAGIGTAIRAAGHGLYVYFAFFIKGRDYDHGEFHILKSIPNITIRTYGQKGFVWRHNVESEDKVRAQKALEEAKVAMLSGKYSLIVLDEVNVVVANKVIDINDMVSFIKSKPSDIELILTGRYAPPQLIELADIVSDIQEVKHPFSEGFKARKGFEF